MINSIQRRLCYNFSIATALVFISFGSIYISKGYPVFGIFEVSLGLVQILNMVFLYNYKDNSFSYRIIVASVYIMTLVVYISGGFGNTGFLWIQFVPLFTVLNLENREAKIWSFLYSVVLGLLILFHLFRNSFLHYTHIQIIQSLVVFFLFHYLTYNNEKLKDIDRNKLEEQNLALKRLSQTDTLTELYNRSYLNEFLNRELYRYNRYRAPLSIIMLDIDHFKKVNDSYGHLCGDEVLVGISRVLQNMTRQTDIAGRWGGEEFLIICSETSLESAGLLADKLRIAISELVFNDSFSVTASFGVTEVFKDQSISVFLAEVDRLLYEAKRNGRNRVESMNR